MTKGLAILLEQGSQKIKVKNGLLDFTTQQGSTQPQISSANLRDVSISQIARGLSNPLKMGEQANAVARIKNAIQYDKDKTVNFDGNFQTFLKQYQASKGLTQTGEIDKELSCYLYPTFCTVQTPNQTKVQEKPMVIQKFEQRMSRFKDYETPTEENCTLLIDFYVTQSNLYRNGQGSADLTEETLAPFKKQIQSCVSTHPILKLKLRKEDDDATSPFYISSQKQSTGKYEDSLEGFQKFVNSERRLRPYYSTAEQDADKGVYYVNDGTKDLYYKYENYKFYPYEFKKFTNNIDGFKEYLKSNKLGGYVNKANVEGDLFYIIDRNDKKYYYEFKNNTFKRTKPKKEKKSSNIPSNDDIANIEGGV